MRDEWRENERKTEGECGKGDGQGRDWERDGNGKEERITVGRRAEKRGVMERRGMGVGGEVRKG